MKQTLSILLILTLGCAAADAGKKVGRRIQGHYPDKGFQQKIEQPKSTPTPSRPYTPYGFNMPTHPPLAFTMPTHPPLAILMPTHPPYV